LDAAIEKQDQPMAMEILKLAMNDDYKGLRQYAVEHLDLKIKAVKTFAEPVLANLVKNEKERKVKAAAIAQLAEYESPQYHDLFLNAVNDSSYNVAGNALEALYRIDPAAGLMQAKALSAMPSKQKLAEVTGSILAVNEDEAGTLIIISQFKNLSFGKEKVDALQSLAFALSQTKSFDNLKQGADALDDFRTKLNADYKDKFGPVVNDIFIELEKAKKAAGLKDQANYLHTLIR